MHAILHKALEHAIRFALIPTNPASRVDPPKVRQEEITPLSAEQASKLLEVARAEGHRFEALYVLALTTGLRIGELLGRPEMVVPVFMNVWAGSWLIASVRIDRMMQMSSATDPIRGSSSQISAPLRPNRLNLCCGPKHLSCLFPWSWAIGWPLVKLS